MATRNSAPLASYIDLLLDAVCAVDKQGRFVFVSAACERIFGYSPDEMIGLPMIDLVHPADRQRTLDAALTKTKRPCLSTAQTASSKRSM